VAVFRNIELKELASMTIIRRPDAGNLVVAKSRPGERIVVAPGRRGSSPGNSSTAGAESGFPRFRLTRTPGTVNEKSEKIESFAAFLGFLLPTEGGKPESKEVAKRNRRSRHGWLEFLAFCPPAR
jgi:hypothetical protein